MPDESEPAPESSSPEQPTLLGNLAPDEIIARAMQTVKMTSGASGIWQPPGVEELALLFPGYEILGLLGRGGMGAVYKARQIELDRMVAIKLLPLEVSVDKDFADRFRREARAMAKLHHPNIIAVHDFGTTREGHLFFVMEFVEGANLADIVHQAGLSGEQALSIVEQVCSALGYAHGKGVVHRDIKPANVMIDIEGEAKVADFGLARLTDPSAEQMGHTMTGTVMGTPDYMAPEQMKGMNVDHRADIYSLGVMVYEMLCREVPRGAFEPPSVRAGCDPRIDPIVLKAMQPNPERRYQSTQEMKADVTAARLTATSAGTNADRPGSHASSAAPQAPGVPSRAAAQPAVVQATSLSESKAKTSKAMFVYAGIVLLAILGVGGLILRNAKRSAEGSVTSQIPGALATPPVPPSEWQNLPLPDQDSLQKHGNSINAAGELHLQTQVSLPSPLSRNLAVRGEVRILEGQSAVSIGLRDRHPTTRRLAMFRDGAVLQLATKDFVNLRPVMTYPESAVVGKWVPFQFAVVDTWSLGTVNSLVLTPARSDEAVEAGTILLSGASGSQAVDLRNLQYVILDGAPETQWPDFVRDGMKTAKAENRETGETSHPTRRPEPWHDWLAEKRQAGEVPKELTPERDGYRVTAYMGTQVGPPCRDQAVRVTFADRGNSGSVQLQVRVRSGGVMYRARVADAIYLEYMAGTDHTQTLDSIPPPEEWLRDPKRGMTVELRAVGDLLTLNVDGQVAATRHDSSIADGRMQMSCAEGWWLKKIEWVSLEKPMPKTPRPKVEGVESGPETGDPRERYSPPGRQGPPPQDRPPPPPAPNKPPTGQSSAASKEAP